MHLDSPNTPPWFLLIACEMPAWVAGMHAAHTHTNLEISKVPLALEVKTKDHESRFGDQTQKKDLSQPTNPQTHHVIQFYVWFPCCHTIANKPMNVKCRVYIAQCEVQGVDCEV